MEEQGGGVSQAALVSVMAQVYVCMSRTTLVPGEERLGLVRQLGQELRSREDRG